jgi:imidazole glycerol phosphate synthase subunit HisF
MAPKTGFDLELTDAITKAVDIPIIASAAAASWNIFPKCSKRPERTLLWPLLCSTIVN